MIVQLPNGRVVELSVELYLDLTDEEINELNGLGIHYTKECINPFYQPFNEKSSDARKAAEEDQDYEPGLDEIDDFDKLIDPDFKSDDV